MRYLVEVMESNNGTYTMQWRLLNTVQANTSREALRFAAPITTRLERPSLTRPRAGVTIFEFDEVKYAVTNLDQR